jgi:hypothetical protein
MVGYPGDAARESGDESVADVETEQEHPRRPAVADVGPEV